MEEENYVNGYKIVCGKKYRIFRSEYNGMIFYYIYVTQKNYDGSSKKYKKNIRFKKGIEVANESDIIIHKMYENLRDNPKDEYNPIQELLVTEFEEIKSQEQIESEALDNYHNKRFGSTQERDYSEEEDMFNDVEVEDGFLD